MFKEDEIIFKMPDESTAEEKEKQEKILKILKKTLNNSFLCLIESKEEQEKVKGWLDNDK